TGFTPVIIIIASMLSLLITVISFGRVNADFEKKETLQKKLEEKDKETNDRIAVIQNIAENISAGDYKTRIDDEALDMLGGLAVALNKMASSLENSFTKLSEREWLQAGIAALSNEVVVEKDIVDFSQGIIGLVAEHTSSISGAFYLRSDEGLLKLHGGYALMDGTKMELLMGEGIAGQCAASAKIIVVNDIVPEDYILSTVAGRVKAKSVIALPLIYNREVRGVIELSSMETYTDKHKTYLELFAANTSIAINTAQNRQRVQTLLEETQRQSEELQSQHEELENINAQLQMQAEKLQSSEEELRVQQEELQQANQELEERSRLLEEKNELVLERNLDIQAKAEELALSTKYKSEFLANMSHELRTPLNSVLLLSRLLSENHEGNLSTDQIEYARVIQNSGNGLLRLIDEILDLSKIEAGKMELEYSDVNIQEVVKELQSLFSPIAKDKGIDFKTVVDKNAPALVETDRLRIEQIMRNLISNALKFTKKGFVQLSISGQNNMLAFAVTDTGIGIPTDKQQNIFEAFQQADGSTRRQF
ncbi:MAG: histidine kinase dimerization/phospho-acceptor domain-containing protein, partial [Bacteroidota bacterium]